MTGEPHIRFYAGAPLYLTGGQAVGTLCVIDRKPRSLSAVQKEILVHLSQVAVRALETRKALVHERELIKVEARAVSILDHSVDAIVTTKLSGFIEHVNASAERMFGYGPGELVGQPLATLIPNSKKQELDLRRRIPQDAIARAHETTR